MTLGSSLMGTPGQIKALPTMTSEQQQLLGQLLGGLGGPLQSGIGNLQQMLSGESGAFAAPAMRQFQEQIVPGLAERFTSGALTGGGLGGRQSSAFQQALGQAGAGLSERLAMQKAGLQERGLSQLQSLLGLGMKPSFQYQPIPGQEGGLQQLLSGIGSGFGSGLGMFGMGGLGKLFGLGG